LQPSSKQANAIIEKTAAFVRDQVRAA